MVSTFQTRVHDRGDAELGNGGGTLSAYSELYGKVERKLFADVAIGQSVTSMEGVYLERDVMLSRMLNAVRMSLPGEVATHQGEAIIGDAVAGVVSYAKEAAKPVLIERLDFRRKKAALEGWDRLRPYAVVFQLRQHQGVLHLPWLPVVSGGTSGEIRPSVRLWAG